ncbi:MAG TPA: 4Fe-4S binding protein [Candidatus Anoxymicrobiaceae bacterium]
MFGKAFVEWGTSPWIMRSGIRFVQNMWYLAKLPFAATRHPWTRSDKNDIRWLPINEELQVGEDMPVPIDLLLRFIEEASHRIVFDFCPCRFGEGCEQYPIDIGCLLMGESALESPSSISHEASVEEARALAMRAVEAGLVPVVGKAKVDNFIFGIKDRARLLTVCFCCECCCFLSCTRRIPLETLESAFPRLSGISIEVTDACKGCGKCVEHCYIGAIEVTDKRAKIDDYCRACGRCANICPNDAIEIRIDDPDFIEESYRRIRKRVDYETGA